MNETIRPNETATIDEAIQVPQRHYELALAEQAMRRSSGRYLTIEEILRRNGFMTDLASASRAKARGGSREDLTMQALRLYVSVANQTAMGVCLLELRDGVLRIAVGDRVDDADLLRITNALHRANRDVLKIEIEPWDRAELARLMREQSEVAGERLLRVFATLSRDSDDATLIEQSVNDILAEALQTRASDIHLSLQEDDARCWIRYRIDGDLVYKHLIPHRVMAPIVTRIKTDSKMDAADRQHPQDGRLAWEWQGRDRSFARGPCRWRQVGRELTLRLLDRENLRQFRRAFHAFAVGCRKKAS